MSITKFGRKFLGVFVVALLALITLASCTSNAKPYAEAYAEANAKAEEIAASVIFDPAARQKVSASLQLPYKTKYKDVMVYWTSSEEDVIQIVDEDESKLTGFVSRPAFDDSRVVEAGEDNVVPVTLSAKVTVNFKYKNDDGKVKTEQLVIDKEFNFTVLCLAEGTLTGTISEIKQGSADYIYGEKGVAVWPASASSVVKSVSFYGVVTAKLMADGSGQIMVHDGTEGIYVYKATDDKINVGDTVLVQGDVYSYYGSLQVGSNVGVTKVPDLGLVVADYTDMLVSEWEELFLSTYQTNPGYIGGSLYRIYAKVVKEYNATTKDEFKLVDPYNDEIAWVYYKSYNASMKEVLESYDGQYVYITGVTYDRDSRSMKNHLLWDGGIEAAPAPGEDTDAIKVLRTKTALKALAETAYKAGASFEFPTEVAEYNATVAWDIPETAPYADGKFTSVLETVKFTAIATITVGDESDTVEIEFTVNPAFSTIAEIKASPANTTGLTLRAIVTAKGKLSSSNRFQMLLADSTGAIYAYNVQATGQDEYDSIQVGDQIVATGKYEIYAGLHEFTTLQVAEITVEKNEQPLPEVVDITEIAVAELLPYQGQLVEITGIISTVVPAWADGSNLQFKVKNAAGEEVTIYIHQNNWNVAGIKEVYETLSQNDTVTVYGWVNWYNGAQVTPYDGNALTKVVLDNDEDKVAADLNNVKFDANVTESFVLPVEGRNGSTISWEVKSGTNVVIEEVEGVLTAVITRPAQGESNVVIVLTAEAVLNEANESRDFTVTIVAEPGEEDSANVMIYQLYGGGGNSGAKYKNDFIVLYNPTDADVNLTGWSIQYASKTGNFKAIGDGTQSYALTGTIAAKSYYLIICAAGSGGVAFDSSIPVGFTTAIAMAGASGKVALANTTAIVSGPTASNVVDFVGFGAEANAYEGNGPTATASNTLGVIRKELIDTDDNAADFKTFDATADGLLDYLK